VGIHEIYAKTLYFSIKRNYYNIIIYIIFIYYNINLLQIIKRALNITYHNEHSTRYFNQNTVTIEMMITKIGAAAVAANFLDIVVVVSAVVTVGAVVDVVLVVVVGIVVVLVVVVVVVCVVIAVAVLVVVVFGVVFAFVEVFIAAVGVVFVVGGVVVVIVVTVVDVVSERLCDKLP